jgi:tetratricopeptide (TPR) repeat protein
VSGGRLLTIAIAGALALTAPREIQAQDPLTLAMAQFQEGATQEAYLLLTSIEGPDSDPMVFLLKGVIERQRRNYDAAMNTFSAGIDAHPYELPLLLERAVTRSWAGDIEGALADYERSIILAPTSEPARLGRARMLAWLERRSASRAAYESVLRTRPDSTEALNGLAFLERASLDIQAARSYYKDVLDLDPDNSEALEGLEMLARMYRSEATIDLGWLGDADLRSGSHSAAAVSHAFNDRLRVFFSADQEVRGLTGTEPTPNAGLARRSVSAAVAFRPSRNVGIDATYRRSGVGADATQRVTAGASIRLSPRWSLIGGVGPGSAGRTGFDISARAGVVLQPGTRTALAVQAFAYTNFVGFTSRSLTAGWTQGFGDRFSLRLGGGAGIDGSGAFYHWTVEPTWWLTPRTGLVVLVHEFNGSTRRRLASAGLRLRF